MSVARLCPSVTDILTRTFTLFTTTISPQVFLKEHARGLYSAYTNYTVFSVPLYLLKTVNATLFAVISWAIMDVDSSTGECCAVFVMCILVFFVRLPC